MSAKKNVVIYKDSIQYELSGPIDDAIAYLQRAKLMYPDNILTISWEPAEWDDVSYLYLCVEREENDNEYNARMQAAAEYSAEVGARERAQYEFLKKKFDQS